MVGGDDTDEFGQVLIAMALGHHKSELDRPLGQPLSLSGGMH